MRSLTLVLLSILIATTSAQSAEKELKGSMQGAFEVFSKLSPYLVEESSFEDPKNHDKILEYLRSLSSSFHTAESVPSKYKDKPGFLATLFVMNSALDDALVSFTQDEKDWASWRLRTVSGTCVSCHSNFGVDVRYKNDKAIDKNLSNYEKAELYLISRQINKAKESFYKAALDAAKEDMHQKMLEATRRLLVIYTRFETNPKEALERIKKIEKSTKHSEYEQEIFNEWIGAFTEWSKEKNPKDLSFNKARKLASMAFGSEPLLSQAGSVQLLRASGIYHQLFMQQKLKKEEKSEALYYLGLIYARLPLYVINEMPQFYLELCIREFPGTPDAKKAYSLYRELTAYGYTGSSGMHLPEDIKAELRELKSIAYGIKRFDPQI